MLQKLFKLKKRPAITSFFGWIFFLGMYLIVGVLSALGVPIETSFMFASPVAILGFLCWVAGLVISVQHLFRGQNIKGSIGALLFSLIPLSFLAFGFFMAVNGGV